MCQLCRSREEVERVTRAAVGEQSTRRPMRDKVLVVGPPHWSTQASIQPVPVGCTEVPGSASRGRR